MTSDGGDGPHDSCFVSVAEDGDVAVVTAPLGLSKDVPVEVGVFGDRLVVGQGARRFLDVEIGGDVADSVESAGAVVLVEVETGDTPERDVHQVRRDVRKASRG